MSLDVYLTDKSGDVIYTSNITHNLNKMAEAAGIYKHLWRPEEIGIKKASELIDPLRDGLHKLVESPSEFKKYNASNGWGLYENFVPWLSEYYEACKNNPSANVEVSR